MSLEKFNTVAASKRRQVAWQRIEDCVPMVTYPDKNESSFVIPETQRYP